MLLRFGRMRRPSLLLVASLALAGCRRDAKAPVAEAEPSTKVDVACEEPVETTGSFSLQPRPDGTLELRLDHAPLLEIRHGGFRSPGKSAGPKVERRPAEDGALAFEVTFETLPVVIRGLLTQPDPQRLHIAYAIESEQPLRDIAGVGLQVDVSAGTWGLGPESLRIEQHRDVALALPEHGTLALTFDPTTGPRTQLDPKTPTRVRAAWLAGSSPAGILETSMTLTLPGPVTLEPPVALRYGPVALDRWHENALVHDDWPVDLRALNAAHGRAGSHGRVVVDGEDLRFEDGTPARFWGTNIAASALFTADDETIERQAKRLSALGYNLVRLHHHDSAWAGRNVFDTAGGTTQVLDPGALERLDRWIDTLAAEGIYVYLDLHTGRQFLPGDAIPGYADMSIGPHPKQARGFHAVNPRVEALMEGFTEAYLRRENRYTGRPWAQEPAVVGILLTNENDLTQHFGVGFRPGSGRETHIAMFDALADAIGSELGLAPDAKRRIHRPGDGKVLLAEMQHRWDARALQHLRSLGVKVPATTTNVWGFESLFNLPPLAFGDMIDVHSYGKAEALSTNPHREAHWLHWIAAAQVSGKPMTVTEWAVPKPEADRFTAPLWIAALGGLQGWDALLAYNYAQTPLGEAPSRPLPWDQRVDPAQLGLAPTAALMFRRGDIAQARTTIALTPDVRALWQENASPRTRAALRTAPERSRMVVVLPDHPKLDWDAASPTPAGARIVTDLGEDLLETGTTVRADTGQLERDWAAGTLRVDAPAVQGASGWIGGHTLRLSDLEIRVDTPKATVVAIALDDAPLARSRRILVTAVARARPQPDGSVRSEPVRGEIALRTQGSWQIAPVGPRDRAHDLPPEVETQPGVRDGAWVRLPLPEAPTHWFIVAPNPT